MLDLCAAYWCDFTSLTKGQRAVKIISPDKIKGGINFPSCVLCSILSLRARVLEVSIYVCRPISMSVRQSVYMSVHIWCGEPILHDITSMTNANIQAHQWAKVLAKYINLLSHVKYAYRNTDLKSRWDSKRLYYIIFVVSSKFVFVDALNQTLGFFVGKSEFNKARFIPSWLGV